jgi:hypothetical protein
MTVVRVDVALDPDRRQGVLDALREQPDVTSVTAAADGFDLELAGYQRDAARSRTEEVLRIVAEATGTDAGALTLAPARDAHPGGLEA